MVTAIGNGAFPQHAVVKLQSCCQDLFNKIIKVFSDFLAYCASFLPCFPTQEELTTRKLNLALSRCITQIVNEQPKSFRYHTAPNGWEPAETLQVGNFQVGVCETQGRRSTMEDKHLATFFTANIAGKNYPIHLFGVFDGHGHAENGLPANAAAEFVKTFLQQKLTENLSQCNPDRLSEHGIRKALKQTMKDLNQAYKQYYVDFLHQPDVALNQGTTAAICMILDGALWTSNVGDSRVVVENDGFPKQISEDQKPSDARFEQSIVKRGGWVSVPEPGDVPRLNGMLATARTIGDFGVGQGLSCSPTTTRIPLNEICPGSHLVLACDGVYDVSTTRDIVAAVHTHKNLRVGNLARNLVYSAYQSGSTDNITAMVVRF